jgi:hypothetical protein
MKPTSESLLLSSISWEDLKIHLADTITSALLTAREAEFQDKLMSVDETRSLLGGQRPLSKTTLAKWTKEGYLNQYRLGSRIYYKYSEIIGSLKTIRRYRRVEL